MDRLTRKELKTDKFAAEVGHTVEYLEEHRRQALIAGAIALVVVLAAAGGYFYMQRQHNARQKALREAERIYQAQIGPASNAYVLFYPTAEAKKEAVNKAFQDLVAKYPRSDEAMIATYYLGVAASDDGKVEEAAKHFRKVVDSANNEYSSQAALALSQLLAGQGQTDEAAKILRKVIERPSALVSKEQATIALARILAPANPEEARKLLEPLRTERSAVSRAALTALSELPGADQQ